MTVGDGEPTSRFAESDVPRLAVIVSIYHIFVMCACLATLMCAYKEAGWFKDVVIRIAAYGVASGAAGGTLNASRYVVLSVRHRRYDPGRLLWQILSPVHSAIFAGFSIALGQVGLVVAADKLDPTAPGYAILIVSLSFLIGFSSELFVKRLISASEALFGETGDPSDDEPTNASP